MRLSAEQGRRFDVLYRRHYVEVFRVCLKFATGDRAWALDRTHDVFLRLAEELPRLRDTDDLGGWIYRVAVNTCYMDLRRGRIWQKIADRLRRATGKVEPSAEPAVQSRRDIAALEGAIRSLPAKERSLITLVLLGGKSQAEAASLLGMSRGYASKLHQRAMKLLDALDWEVAHA